MTGSFEFGSVERFAVGALGDPGERTFFVQFLGDDGSVVTFKLEKQQVDALADHLEVLLSDLAPVEHDPAYELDLVEPILPEWVIGAMGTDFDEDGDRVVLMAEELVPEDTEVAANTVRVGLSRMQVRAFVDRARELVASGRPLCRLCGGPIDPDGHACPRLN